MLFGRKCKHLHKFGGDMKKKLFSKAVIRELLPYCIFILFSILLMNGGMLYVLVASVEREQIHQEQQLEKYVEDMGVLGEAPEDIWDLLDSIHRHLQYYEASLYRMMFAANILVILAGGLLIIWQLVRYVAPTRHVLDYMYRGKKIHYSNLSNEIIGSLEDYKACKLRLEQMESGAQTEFIEKLSNAEFKSESRVRAEAENVGIEVYGYQYLVIVVGIFNNVAEEDVDAATIYESAVILDYLKAKREWERYLSHIWFKKISYRRMMIVLQLAKPFFMDMLYGMREEFLRRHGVSLFWGVSRICEDPLYLWKGKAEAYIAINCCDVEHVCVAYTPELEAGVKYYLPVVARNNLLAYIKSGNITEITKIIAMLKDENCVKRRLSHNQLVNLNSRVIRMLGKLQEQDKCNADGVIDDLNQFVLQNEGSHEEYFDRLKAGCMALCTRCNEEKQDRKNRLAEKIKAYVDEHYQDSSLSLTQLGIEFNISDSYVSLIFKEHIGIHFSTYVEEIRLSHAAMLLESSSMTVREIAEQTGYTNEQSFRRAFKKVRGLSPKEAREAVNIRKSS